MLLWGGGSNNKFSYADDLALKGPSAMADNMMLKICDTFAIDHDVIFSTTKSVCMLIQICNTASRFSISSNIYLSGNRLGYVDSFKYLGHYHGKNERGYFFQ